MPLGTLFLVDGAAGAGKTDMVSYIRANHERSGTACVITKLTTRERRPEEQRTDAALDLHFVSPVYFHRQVSPETHFSYVYGDHEYAIAKAAILDKLPSFSAVFVIVRNAFCIQAIKTHYPSVRCIALYIHTDVDKALARLKREHATQEQIQFRLGRLQLASDDYLTHRMIYDEIILNNSSRIHFQQTIAEVLAKHTTRMPDEFAVTGRTVFRLPNALVGFRDVLQRQLEHYPYEKNIFLMMKYRDSNQELFEFVREEIQRREFNCARADLVEWSLTNDLYNPLAVLYCCKYGIALFDEAEEYNAYSPNVAYELGIMQMQQKKCLILAHKSLPPAPFDLIKDIRVSYTSALQIRKSVVSWLGSLASSFA